MDELCNSIKRLMSLNNRKRSTSSTDGEPPFKDLGPVIQAPLDQKRYKVIELRNGLKACIVSTCTHETAPSDNTELFKSCLSSSPDSDEVLEDSIDEFNKKHLYNWTQRNNWIDGQGTKNSPHCQQTSAVKRSFPNSPAPPTKARKLLQCSNGPSTICFSVGVGSFHDPSKTNGLAHLVEHAIFLGSKQYPEPNVLFTKVFENGGVVNATTHPEHTDFYFSCAHPAFDECVAILADAIINPLLNNSDILREIKAIDSEYKIKQTDEMLRINDFLRSKAKADHPFRRFYWGHNASLKKVDIVNEVRDWKKRYYCADYITVCIQAPMPIEKLEAFAVKHLSDIPRSLPQSESPTNELLSHKEPYAPEDFQTAYFVAPLGHFTCLVITWTLSDKFWKAYETKPLEYIRFLFETTSPGGLKRHLRQQQWMSEWNNLAVNCCNTDDYCRNVFCSFFGITIYLTDKGYQEKEKVLISIFSYLKMLSRGGVRPELFKEMQSNVANKFHLQNWDEMLQSGVDIAVDLHYVPPIHVLTSKVLMTKWEPKLIQEALDSLTPASANFTFVSRENISFCKQTALPCGIRYSQGKIDPPMYKQMENTNVINEFNLPPDGTLLPKYVSVGPHDTGYKALGTIHKTDTLTVEYVSELKTPLLAPLVPSASYSVYFNSPMLIGRTGRMKFAVLEYWSRLLMDRIIEESGHKFDHVFTFEVDIDDYGMEMQFVGPRCHLVELLTLVIRQLFGNCGLDDDTDGGRGVAQNLKLDLLREYRNSTYDVETLSKDLMYFVQQDSHNNLYELLAQLEDVSLREDFFDLINSFRKRMLVAVEVHGSMTAGDAHQIVQLLTGESEVNVKYSRPPFTPHSNFRSTLLPLGTSLLSIKALHPAYVTSVINNFYQVDNWQGKGAAQYVIILHNLMRRRIANQLRTNEQLGYTVRLSPVHYDWGHGSLGIRVTVLAHPQNHSANYVDARIELFLLQFYQKSLKRDDQVRAYIKKHWFKDNDADERLAELERFYRDNLLTDGANFRKLSILLEGYLPGTKVSKKKQDKLTAEGEGKSEKDDDADADGDEEDSSAKLEYSNFSDHDKRKMKKDGITVIDNIAFFKRTLSLLPVVHQ